MLSEAGTSLLPLDLEGGYVLKELFHLIFSPVLLRRGGERTAG